MRWRTKYGAALDRAAKGWHLWFALYPVRLNNCTGWAWWETVERRLSDAGWGYRWLYRTPRPTEATYFRGG